MKPYHTHWQVFQWRLYSLFCWRKVWIQLNGVVYSHIPVRHFVNVCTKITAEAHLDMKKAVLIGLYNEQNRGAYGKIEILSLHTPRDASMYRYPATHFTQSSRRDARTCITSPSTCLGPVFTRIIYKSWTSQHAATTDTQDCGAEPSYCWRKKPDGWQSGRNSLQTRRRTICLSYCIKIAHWNPGYCSETQVHRRLSLKCTKN